MTLKSFYETKILEKFREHDLETPFNLESYEDEKFVYLEFENSYIDMDDLVPIGNELDARSIGKINGGPKYGLSIPKNSI